MVKKMFRIVELEDCKIKQYVFLTDAESVESQLTDIYDALKDKPLQYKFGSSFTVIVDTFLRSGFRDNRFIAIMFVDGKHKGSFIIDYENVPYELKRKSFDLIYDDVSLLDNCLISKRYVDVMKQFIAYTKVMEGKAYKNYGGSK